MLDVKVEIAGVKLGLVEAAEVRVQLVVAELAAEMDAVCERIRGQQTVDELMGSEKIAGVRAMFRGWGVDPARYRPSSEALLRRVVQGKGPYRINNVVDADNLCSIESGWPSGLYDLEFVQPPVVFRLGLPGEIYEGIGRHAWHPEDRPVLADAAGPIGSPISDSTRTMVRETTRNLLTVFYVPAAVPDASVRAVLDRYAERLTRHASARIEGTTILQPI